MHLPSLLWSLGIAICFAVAGNMFVNREQMTWFRGLRQPPFSLPIEAWYVVGALYYVMMISILYRILVHPATFGRVVALTLCLILLALNEAWNYVFFGRRSVRNGFRGVAVFCGVALVFEASLIIIDPGGALLFVPYLLWLVYDLYWSYSLMRLNRPWL